MNILETFQLVFEADATKLQQSLKDIQTGSVGAVKDLDNIEKKNATLGHSFTKMAGVAMAGFAMLQGIGSIAGKIQETAEFADNIQETSEVLGVNQEALQLWGRASADAGGSAEAFQGTVKSMSTAIAMLETTGKSRAKPFFDELGVAMLDANGKGRPIMEMLPELADKFSKMDAQKALGMATKMGIDEGTLAFLKLGREEVEKQLTIQERIGVVTEEQSNISSKYMNSQTNLGRATDAIWGEVAELVLPTVQTLIDYLVELFIYIKDGFNYLTEHQDIIKGMGIALAILAGYMVLTAAASMTLAGAWGVLAAVAGVLFSPIALLIGAVILFGLVFEDVNAFLKGNNSLIGEISKKYPIVGGVIKALVAVFKEGFGTIKQLINWLVGAFDNPKKAFNEFKNYIGEVFDGIGVYIGKLIDDFLNMHPKIKAIFDKVGGVFTWLKNLVKGIFEDIVGFINSPHGALDNFFGKISSISGAFGDMNLCVNTSTAQLAPQAIGNKNNVTIGKIDIKTKATDAKGISKAIGSSINVEVSKLNQNAKTGYKK